MLGQWWKLDPSGATKPTEAFTGEDDDDDDVPRWQTGRGMYNVQAQHPKQGLDGRQILAVKALYLMQG